MGAGPGKVIQLQVAVGVDGLLQNLKVATKGVDDAAQQMNASFKGLGEGAKHADKAHGSFLDTLKEFKKEQTQQTRYARFYANELASIVPGAGAAKNAVMGLGGAMIEGLAGGGALAVGFELAKVGLESLNEMLNEEKKQEMELAEQHFKTFTAMSESIDKAAKGYVTLRSKTEELEVSLREGINKQVKEMRFQLEETLKHQGWLSKLFGSSEVDALREKIAGLLTELNNPKVAGKLKLLQEEESIAEATKAADEMRRLFAGLGDETTRIRTETDIKLNEIDRRYREAMYADDVTMMRSLEATRESIVSESQERIRRIKVQKQLAFEEEAFQFTKGTMDQESQSLVLLDMKIRKYKELAKQFPAEAEHYKLLIKLATEAQARDTKKAQDERVFAAESAKRGILEQARNQKQAEDLEIQKSLWAALEQKAQGYIDVAASMGDAFGQAFALMITGAKSFAGGMADIFKSIVSLVISALQKMIMAWAVESAAAAFSSQAGIPIVGPFLGAAAAAAALGLVGGLVSQLPSAAGGWDVPQGINPITQVHEREMVLPAQYADVIRGMANGSPSGGGTVVIHAIDARGVKEFVESGDFARAWQQARRNGRL